MLNRLAGTAVKKYCFNAAFVNNGQKRFNITPLPGIMRLLTPFQHHTLDIPGPN